MPWQQHVADVALEVDPDTGLLVYREVDLTVPRQSGKTSLLLAVMVHRAQSFGGDQQIKYTAQTRNDARHKWEDGHVKILERSPFRHMFKVRLTNGAEAIKWANGSMHGITSTTEKAGHGDTLDLGVIDEAFAHIDARLEQGLRPTMITRPQPQLWIPSTAGTRTSTYLRGKVDNGRARCDLGLTSGTANFEWSAPGDADPANPDTWHGCMPALCPAGPPCRCDPHGRWHHTVFEAAIRGEFESMELREFRRAYLNQWPGDAPEEWLVIPQKTWADLGGPPDPDGPQMVMPVAFAADINPDRSFGSIALAGARTDGRTQVEVTDHLRGTGWMVRRLVELCEKWKVPWVVVDAAGPAGSLIASLEAAGIEVVKPTARDATHAAQSFYDLCCDSANLRHLDDPALNSALAGAQKRPLGDAWAWDRKGPSVDISPLVAASLAAWGHAARPREETKNAPATVRTAAPTGSSNSLWRPTSRLQI
jgi:hypothetical protein